MRLKPGMRLKSAVSDVEVMIVKAPDDDDDLRCGGIPMLAPGEESNNATTASPFGNTLLGKRYADSNNTLELLCIKGGVGVLTLGSAALEPKTPKPLPSSD